MNPAKKLYCRTFQTVFKIALPEIIEKHKCSRILIITDPGIRKLNLTARPEPEANPLYPVPVLMDAGEPEIFYRNLMEPQKK